MAAKGLADEASLYERKEAWADAYRRTPHRKPVQLRAGFRINYQYQQSPLHRVTHADGQSKEIRIKDGQLFVCHGCCCGQTQKSFPSSPLDEFKRQWKARGIRRRFHLTISGCLGPCPLANLVMIHFKGQSIWFHSINRVEDVSTIYGYVEHMLMEQSDLDPPALLASRHFQRYLVDTAEPCEESRPISGN